MSSEQAIHRQLLAAVAEAENPAQIIAEAKKLNLVTPSSITQLPAVPLTTPVGQATTAPTSNASSTAAAGPSATAGR